MIKIGRNDLCTCGSGKKHKKCCGKETVVSLDHLIQNELHGIQHDVLHFSISQYGEEIDEYLEEQFDSYDIPHDAMDMFRFFAFTWVITSVEFNGQTVLEEYINQNYHNASRPRIKEILQTWKGARPSVYIIQDQDENQQLTVQDIFTEETRIVKMIDEMDHNVESGGILLGTILPAGSTSIFFTTFLNLPASEAENASLAVLDLFDSDIETSEDFMASSYLDVLDLFLFGIGEVSLDNLEWRSSKHQEVAESYKDRMESYGHDETVINLGLLLWNKYCDRRNPMIKKSGVYEAALVYLVERLVPFIGYSSQKELAEEYDVSSGSISSKFKELEEVLEDELDELRSAVNDIDFDDFYGEDIFDEEDFDAAIFDGIDEDHAFIDSRITMERELRNMERVVGDKDFASIEEANEFLNNHFQNKKPVNVNLSDKEKAQELIYDAYEAKGKKRQQLAKKALNLYPYSPDAYNILAEVEYDVDQELNLYKKGIDVGEKELGQSFFDENKGLFWGIVETRPYMRAKYNYARLLHDIDEIHAAIPHYKELLELNENDNQGVRVELFLAYVEIGELKEAEALLKKYDDVFLAQGVYNKLLVEFLQNGPTEKAVELVKQAKKKNPYIFGYLTEKMDLSWPAPAAFRPGEESEAGVYLEQHEYIWFEHPKMIKWLKSHKG